MVEMAPTGNRIGNGNEGQGDIIHAEGVRGDFLSSAPKARGAEYDELVRMRPQWAYGAWIRRSIF